MEKKVVFADGIIVSEVEVTYKSKIKASSRPSINSPADSYNVLIKIWDMNKIELLEHFYALYLNNANRVLGAALISSGGISTCVADPRVIMVIALKLSATGIILAHSHPSGSLNPSSIDIAMTQKLKNGGEFLDIRVLDHLIVTKEGYYSFANEGLI